MMFPEESRYGWGVYDIPMPRAVGASYPVRRKMTGKTPFPIRRKVASNPWCSSSVFRIFIDDFPWGQALLLTFLSAAVLTSISVFNSAFRIHQDEQLSKSVDIIVSVIEEEDRSNISPIEEKPLPTTDYDHVQQEVVRKPTVEEPQQIIITELKGEKQAVNSEKQRGVPEEPLADAREKPSISHKLTKPPLTIASTVFPTETLREHEKITIPPPAFHQRKYMGKDTDRISQRTQSDVATNLVSREKNEPTTQNFHVDRLQRKYKSTMSNPANSRTTQQRPSKDLVAFNRLAVTAEVALPEPDQSTQRYALKGKHPRHPMQAASPDTDQQVSFQSRKRIENTKLEPQTRVRSFPTRSPPRHSASQGTARATGFPTLKQQTPALDVTTPPKRRLSGGRYVFAENNRNQSLIPEGANQKFSFRAQKRGENLILVPPAQAKSFSNDHQLRQNSSTFSAGAPDFSGEVLPDAIDPPQLISLREFNVCKDPEEEFRLKTQLATRLDGPSWVEAGKVLFFCKYPESGYTMQVDIYNPHGRLFKDRCELLQLAVNGLLNTKK
jgi:hypothetical protein